MTKERTPEFTPRMQQALVELQALISKRYPDATFRTSRSPENPETVLLKPVVDVDDRDELMDVVIDRLGELQAQEQLSLLVVPIRPKARSAAIQRAMEQTEPTWHKQPLCQVLIKVNFLPSVHKQVCYTVFIV